VRRYIIAYYTPSHSFFLFVDENGLTYSRDAEAGSGGGSPFSVEAEARKFYRFHIGYLT